MAAICSAGVSPSGGRSTTPAATCFFKPATRIMKNSSRLEPTMARDFTRSSSGLLSSWASSNTRRWNSSMLSSRLMKSLGSFRSTWAMSALVFSEVFISSIAGLLRLLFAGFARFSFAGLGFSGSTEFYLNKRIIMQLLAELIYQGFEHFNARIPFAVAFDDRPGSCNRAGLKQHLVDHGRVDVPFIAIAPVFVSEFPMAQQISGERFETAQLFFLAAVDPKFKEDRPEIDQLTLELVDLAISPLPFVFCTKSFHALYHNPAIPPAVKNGDLAGFGQASPKPIEVVAGGIRALRGGGRGEHKKPRAPPFRYAA